MSDLAVRSIKDILLDNYEKRIHAQAAEIERLRAAIEQTVDDMGETGHCVCEQTKQMLRDAIANEQSKEPTP